MPSSKWRSERSGPNWLMDEQGRVIGYRDELGNEYKMPSEPVSGGIADNDEPSSSVSGAWNARATRKVAILGDSISYDWWSLTSVASANRNDASVWLTDRTFEQMAHGWASWVGPLSMGALEVIYNGAVNGAEVLTGQAGDGAPMSAQVDALLAHPKWREVDIVACAFTTNDADASSTTNVSDIITAYLAQLARLASKTVVICTPIPVDSTVEDGSAGGSSPLWAHKRRLCDALRQMVRNSGGRFLLADFNAAVVDPASATGRAKTGILRDTLHPTTKGAALMGQEFVTAVMQNQTSRPDWLTSNANDIALSNTPNGPLNIVPNGLFINGASPGAGWTFNNFAGATGTHSLVTNPTGYGQALRVASSGAAKSDSFRVISANLSSLVAPGDRLFAQMYVTVPANSKLIPSVRLVVAIDGVTYLRSALQAPGTASFIEAPDNAMNLLIRTPDLLIPAGTSITNVQVSMTAVYGAAGGPSNVDISHAEGRKVMPDLY